MAKPNPAAALRLPNGRTLDRSKPVITFVNRNFEPLRGYHIFMRALPRVLAEVPEAEVVLIGKDGVRGYGGEAPGGGAWKQKYLDEVRDRLDMNRVHFTGTLPYPDLLNALYISCAHVYYTYPFVLSWSLLDAMASECLVIASNTAPVRDVVEDGRDGVLLDFFDVDGLSSALIEACRNPSRFEPLRKAAREKMAAEYDRNRICRPAWLQVVDEVMAR